MNLSIVLTLSQSIVMAAATSMSEGGAAVAASTSSSLRGDVNVGILTGRRELPICVPLDNIGFENGDLWRVVIS